MHLVRSASKESGNTRIPHVASRWDICFTDVNKISWHLASHSPFYSNKKSGCSSSELTYLVVDREIATDVLIDQYSFFQGRDIR